MAGLKDKAARVWAILGGVALVTVLGIAVIASERIGPWLRRLVTGGLRLPFGGDDAGADRAVRQLDDNKESIASADGQLERNSEAVRSADEQLDSNSRASAALDAALERLRRARDGNGS